MRRSGKKHKEGYESRWIGSQAGDKVAMSKVLDWVGVLLVFWGKVILGGSRHVTEPSEGSVRMIAQATSGSSNPR
jgi:hypothetical protein